MNANWLLEQLKKPEIYGPKVVKVEMLQTHISYVFLTGEYAYKVKKPVNFGFLDFSTLEKRRFFCEEEIRLNKRLCPDMYLEIVPITVNDNCAQIKGDGEVIEYAVKMRQFPQNRIMTKVLQNEIIGTEVIEHICTALVDFYKTHPSSNEIAEFGREAVIKQNIKENFEQTKSKIDIIIPHDIFMHIKEMDDRFFKKNKVVFEHRRKAGCIHDCHGDLHSGNIVLTDTVLIFDCIEFNKRFRYCDVASDIGFLAMDLDFLNHPFLSSFFIQCYVEKSGDSDVFSVLNFYKCYRAFVRGKIAGFRLDDPHISKPDKAEAVQNAHSYFLLSQYYSYLMDVELSQKKSVLFLVGGLTGTGKSTIAGKIAVDYGAYLINTDVVRKEMVGIDKFEPHRDSFNTGLYDPRNIDRTYEQVIEKAHYLHTQGRSVIVDASFIYKRHRDLASSLAHQLRLPLIAIQCICEPSVVKKRLKNRMQEKTVSDGRWEIYQQQKKTIDPFDSFSHYIEFDTGNPEYTYRMKQFTKLAKIVKKVCE
jgi:aminoglycoside phosphotransferase family enzyme/predicted kinase